MRTAQEIANFTGAYKQINVRACSRRQNATERLETDGSVQRQWLKTHVYTHRVAYSEYISTRKKESSRQRKVAISLTRKLKSLTGLKQNTERK